MSGYVGRLEEKGIEPLIRKALEGMSKDPGFLEISNQYDGTLSEAATNKVFNAQDFLESQQVRNFVAWRIFDA